MKNALKRVVVGASAAGLLAGGALVNAAPAQAAPGPGDLQIYGWVKCTFKVWGPKWTDGPVWQMERVMGVRNIGGSTMTGVHVAEFGGANKFVGTLKPGGFKRTVENKWRGCWPASVSGYTIGDQVENPINNVGYWENQESRSIRDGVRNRGGSGTN